jgi:hypothetical protein
MKEYAHHSKTAINLEDGETSTVTFAMPLPPLFRIDSFVTMVGFYFSSRRIREEGSYTSTNVTAVQEVACKNLKRRRSFDA